MYTNINPWLDLEFYLMCVGCFYRFHSLKLPLLPVFTHVQVTVPIMFPYMTVEYWMMGREHYFCTCSVNEG